MSSRASEGAALPPDLAAAPGQLPPPAFSTVPPADDVTVADAINALLTGKARAARSEEYLRQIPLCFASFAVGRSRRLAVGVILRS